MSQRASYQHHHNIVFGRNRNKVTKEQVIRKIEEPLRLLDQFNPGEASSEQQLYFEAHDHMRKAKRRIRIMVSK